jgi:hypothetical protein
LCTKIPSKPFESAAYGGFMDVESSSNLQQSLPVEVIGGEQKPVFGIDASERTRHGDRKLIQVGGN